MLTKIKFITIIACLAFPLVSAADISGWLAGLQLGRYNADYNVANQSYQTYQGSTLGGAPTKEDQGHYAGRAFLGYSFNQYLATEFGYTRYQGTKFENIYGVLNANVDLDLQSFDLVGKVKLPLNDLFNIYAKLGVAYVKKDEQANRRAKTIETSNGLLVLPDNDKILYRSTYGVGATYNLNPTFAIDAGWSRIQGQGQIKDTDFGFIGVTYYFDQFLT